MKELFSFPFPNQKQKLFFGQIISDRCILCNKYLGNHFIGERKDFYINVFRKDAIITKDFLSRIIWLCKECFKNLKESLKFIYDKENNIFMFYYPEFVLMVDEIEFKNNRFYCSITISCPDLKAISSFEKTKDSELAKRVILGVFEFFKKIPIETTRIAKLLSNFISKKHAYFLAQKLFNLFKENENQIRDYLIKKTEEGL